MSSIAYFLGANLYINLTNRCTAACDFCLRQDHDTVGDSDSLWLEGEPSGQEILDEVLSKPWQQAPQIVFCGFGEPFLRLDELLWVAAALKERKPDVVIRVNTNGHGNLIYGQDVTPRLKGLVDVLSISLNYPDAAQYELHCRSRYGEAAHQGLQDFAQAASRFVPTVILTVVDLIPAADIEACRAIAQRLGVEFRVRTTIDSDQSY